MGRWSGCYLHYTILRSIDLSLRGRKVDKVLEGRSCASSDYIGVRRGEHCVEGSVLLVAAGLDTLA